MERPLRIAVIGDYREDATAHRANAPALELAGTATGHLVVGIWNATDSLEREVGPRLSSFDAIWCVPAGPYANMDGALASIRYARERGVPFLGTCAGFQHAVIEYARNVMGISAADHEETHPGSENNVISLLTCALVEKSETIELKDGSRIREIYGVPEIFEQYHCNYGLNPKYRARLEAAGMRMTAEGVGGEARAMELDHHPFFMGTLFQPERAGLAGRAHPLICAFVKAAAEARTRKGAGDANLNVSFDLSSRRPRESPQASP